MKKYLFTLLLVLTLAITGCGASGDDSSSGSTEAGDGQESVSDTEGVGTLEENGSTEAEENGTGSASGELGTVMTYAEYVAADIDTQVVVETYVQAKQSWYEGKATVYSQDEDGAYFLYDMTCSEEDYEKLVPGTKIKVTGYKSEWSGEIEIIDAAFEIQEGSYIAEAEDITGLLGSDGLIDHQNKFVAFKGLTVEDAGNGNAFMYGWDDSGSDGDDLYFKASVNGETYTFTVESDLCDKTTEVYSGVKNLKVGDVIDMEGFLYWYEGVNPHITSVTNSNS